MLFIARWELNPNFDPSELAEIVQKLVNARVWPAEGAKIIAWYISTCDNWGIIVVDAKTEEQMLELTNMWRIAKPGFFVAKVTTPAMDLVKSLPVFAKLGEKIKAKVTS